MNKSTKISTVIFSGLSALLLGQPVIAQEHENSAFDNIPYISNNHGSNVILAQCSTTSRSVCTTIYNSCRIQQELPVNEDRNLNCYEEFRVCLAGCSG